MNRNTPVFKVLEQKYLDENPAFIQALKANVLKYLQKHGVYVYIGDVKYREAIESLEDAIIAFQSANDNVIVDKLVQIWTEANAKGRKK